MATAFQPITPSPSDFTTSDGVAWFFTMWGGGMALACLPWLLRRAISRRDYVPALVALGGLICSLQEAGFDALCHLWWARNLPGPVWTGFGIGIPLLIPFCYAATIG